MQVHKNQGHSLVPKQSTQQIARTPPWVQHTAPAESPVRNAWANTGAVTLPPHEKTIAGKPS